MEYFYSESDGKVRYTIKEARESGCSITLEYLEGSYFPDGAGKNMTCDFDNTIDFKRYTEYLLNPDDFACKGLGSFGKEVHTITRIDII